MDTVRTEEGRQATIVHDTNGRIVYPSYVPPATTPPVNRGTSEQIYHGGAPSHQQTQEAQDASNNLSPDAREPSNHSPQPAVRRWKTWQQISGGQSPKLTRRADTYDDGVAGGGARTGGEALGNNSSSSSSSSSEESSEEEDEQARRKSKKQTKKRAKDEDDRFRRFRISNEHYRTKGRVSKRDGRLKISLHDTSNTGYLAKALGTAARKMVPLARTSEDKGEEEAERPSSSGKQNPDERPTAPEGPPLPPPPRLNIVIMVIGSRGDAQPFLEIARILHAQYGHRVRIATHPAFRTFVQEDCPGVEFFSVGGDPSELMVCPASLCSFSPPPRVSAPLKSSSLPSLNGL